MEIVFITDVTGIQLIDKTAANEKNVDNYVEEWAKTVGRIELAI